MFLLKCFCCERKEMGDPKICNKCCKYTDCFYANEAVCYNCEEPKIKRRQKDQSIDKQREKRIIMASRASKLLIVILMFLQGCVPLTTNSEAFVNVKKNLEINAENSILISKKLDKVSDKLGLDLPPLTAELQNSLKQLQADNDKKYDLLNAQMLEIGKTLAKLGLGALGVPPVVTNAGLSAVEMAMGTGLVATGLKMGGDFLAMRRRKQEHEQELEDIKEQAKAEKEEIKKNALIKQRTMAKINPSSQVEYDKCKEEAVRELRLQGEIT